MELISYHSLGLSPVLSLPLPTSVGPHISKGTLLSSLYGNLHFCDGAVSDAFILTRANHTFGFNLVFRWSVIYEDS